MKLDVVTPTLCALLAVAGAMAAPSPPAQGKKELADAVSRLADESFAVRQAATRELWKMGEAAMPRLREVADGEDPEAATRARDLLRKIELGILPDSSPLLVELVMRYDRGGADERRVVIREMKRMRAWRQILKLFALETDEPSLAMLEIETRGVAVSAAREALSSDPPDISGALSYLEMARPDPAEFMAKAALHRANGTLEDEIDRSEDAEGENIHLWRYALLSAAGRLKEAAAEAELAGRERTAARLLMLDGDPVAWLKTVQPSAQTIPALGLASYREFVIESWEGRPVDAELLRQMRRFVRGGDDEDRAKELRLLFLAGQHGEAEKLLVDLDPRAAFYYFEAAERIDEALRVFGIDPAEPDYKAWAMERFEVLIESPDQEEHEIAELSLVGYFLERHGLHEELDAAYTGPLVELARTDQENFVRACARLFSGGVNGLTTPTVGPVIKAIAASAGDDEVRWVLLVENLFDRQERPDQLWNWLGVLNPGEDKTARLELLCRIHGLLPDPDDAKGGFFKKSWAAIEKMDPAERGPKVDMMVELSQTLDDAENFLRGVEALEAANQAAGNDELWEGFKGSELGAVGRWEEAAAEWLKVLEHNPAEPIYHALAAAALRRSGNHPAADDQEHLAELLALGDTATQYTCGRAFAAAGDFARATTWWKRAAVESTRESAPFFDTLVLLSDAALADADWKLAASLAEAQAFRHAMSGSQVYRLPTTYMAALSLRMRTDADLARAFSRLETNRAVALKSMERAVALPFVENSLADSFFAPMRAAGLVEIHDRAFERLWADLKEGIERFPGADNTRNAAAWLASRANRRLGESREYLAVALEDYPRQAAYLDTMAEVYFAQGDREKAIDYSTRALQETPGDIQLIRQHQRFASGPFPPE